MCVKGLVFCYLGPDWCVTAHMGTHYKAALGNIHGICPSTPTPGPAQNNAPENSRAAIVLLRNFLLPLSRG